jgi:hypothetical protein
MVDWKGSTVSAIDLDSQGNPIKTTYIESQGRYLVEEDMRLYLVGGQVVIDQR